MRSSLLKYCAQAYQPEDQGFRASEPPYNSAVQRVKQVKLLDVPFVFAVDRIHAAAA